MTEGLRATGASPGARQASSRREIAAAAGLLGVALAVFFPLLRGRVLFERDILTYFVAQVETFVAAVGAGSWPVWDPWVTFGQPMLAQPDTQVLYPLTWLHLILPVRAGYGVIVLIHLGLSGIGLLRLARLRGATTGAAFVGAAVWMLSGPFLSLANVHHFAGAAWMPWVLAAAERTAESRGRVRDVLRWGSLTGVQVLTGSADSVLMTALFTAGIFAPRLLPSAGPERRSPVRLGVAALAAAALGLGLSAPLWLPTLEVARNSTRWNLSGSVQEYWSLHPLTMLQIDLPLFLVDLPLGAEWRQALFEGREPFIESVYVGLPALALAAGALVGRSRGARPLAAIAAVSTLVALGSHTVVYGAARAIIPPLALLRYPQKAMVPVALALALLAAEGVDTWSSPGFWTRRRGFVLGLGAAALAGAAAPVVLLLRSEDIGSWALLPVAEAGAPYAEIWAPVVAKLWPAALAGVGVLLAAGLAAAGRLSAGRSAQAAGVLAVANLFAAHSGLHPTAPADLLSYRSPILDVLRGRHVRRLLSYDYGAVAGSAERYLGRHGAHLVERVPRGWSYRAAVAFGLQQYLIPPMPARYGIPGSFDVDHRGLYRRELDALTRLAWTLDGSPAARLRLLQLGGVSHVVALHSTGFESLAEIARIPSVYAEPIRVFEVPDPQPRTYVVDGVRRAPQGAAMETLVSPLFDFRREVVVEAGLSAQEAKPGEAGESRVVVFRPDRVELDVRARRDAVVVLLDSFDPGWHATVDGRPAPIVRANVAFRAVEVPAGDHRVRMEYWPRGLTPALAAMALTGILALAAAIAFRRDDAPNGPSADGARGARS